MDKTPPMTILWPNWCYETYVSFFSSFFYVHIGFHKDPENLPFERGAPLDGQCGVGAMLHLDGISCPSARNGNTQLSEILQCLEDRRSLWPVNCRQHMLHKGGHWPPLPGILHAVFPGPGPTLCIKLLHPVCLSHRSSLFIFSSWHYYRFWCVFYFNKSTLCLVKFIRTRYLKNKKEIQLHTCFLNLKLNSHIGSCLFPTIFRYQKSKHYKKIK